MSLNARSMIPYALLGILLLIPLLLFMWFFAQLPIEDGALAIDWVPLWEALEGGWIHYEITEGLRQPPWSVLPLLPLGLLPMRYGWGALVFVMMVVLLVGVPRVPNRRRYLAAVLLMLLSFPTLRTAVDGNFEILSTAGALLLVYAYREERPVLLAIGGLLLTSKPQVALLLVIVLAFYLLRTWPPKQWLLAAGIAIAVIAPTMLIWGADWLAAVEGTYQRGSIMDSSLAASLRRTGTVPELIVWIARTAIVLASLGLAYATRFELSREKAGMLIAGMLLVAPYAAGNSVLSVLAVGIIPLFLRRPWIGGLLIALVNLPFLFIGNTDLMYQYSAYYWTGYLLLAWAILGWTDLSVQ